MEARVEKLRGFLKPVAWLEDYKGSIGTFEHAAAADAFESTGLALEPRAAVRAPHELEQSGRNQ